MKFNAGKFAVRCTAAFALSLFVLAMTAWAGPPLVCHVFEIGDTKSLPWARQGWNLTGNEKYDTKHLAADTIAILDGNFTVLVHMETLRRATLYGRKDPVAAKELLTKLMAREQNFNNSASQALAIFDLGYLAATYNEWFGAAEPNPASGIDGDRFVRKAILLRGDDAQMEFAAALITLRNPGDDHVRHAEKAISGGKSDPLLARNLASPFHGKDGVTMAELIWSGPSKIAAKN
jgi:hypothetical protein